MIFLVKRLYPRRVRISCTIFFRLFIIIVNVGLRKHLRRIFRQQASSFSTVCSFLMSHEHRSVNVDRSRDSAKLLFLGRVPQNARFQVETALWVLLITRKSRFTDISRQRWLKLWVWEQRRKVLIFGRMLLNNVLFRNRLLDHIFAVLI